MDKLHFMGNFKLALQKLQLPLVPDEWKKKSTTKQIDYLFIFEASKQTNRMSVYFINATKKLTAIFLSFHLFFINLRQQK